MKYVSAIIFPETEPSNHVMVKFLLFFNTLSYYLPIESEGTESKDNGLFTPLCSGYAPAPLGEDISRFSRLLREMETSRTDELARLFSAAMAPMATGEVMDKDETSSAGVYSALQRDPGTNTSIRHKERLWQARLMLKLAELLDRREEEVRQGLAQVSSVERKVFASLEGLSEAKADSPAELSGSAKLQAQKDDDILPDETSLGTSGLLIPMRLKAWAQLYLQDSSDQRPLILATASSESGSILLEGYENAWHRDLEKLFSLPIPDVFLADRKVMRDEYLATRKIFREDTKKNLEYFAKLLQKTSSITESTQYHKEDHSLLTDNVSAWEKKLTAHYPGRKTDFKKLDFYCFPGIPFTELFQRVFHLEKPVQADILEQPTALLAILKP